MFLTELFNNPPTGPKNVPIQSLSRISPKHKPFLTRLAKMHGVDNIDYDPRSKQWTASQPIEDDNPFVKDAIHMTSVNGSPYNSRMANEDDNAEHPLSAIARQRLQYLMTKSQRLPNASMLNLVAQSLSTQIPYNQALPLVRDLMAEMPNGEINEEEPQPELLPVPVTPEKRKSPSELGIDMNQFDDWYDHNDDNARSKGPTIHEGKVV
jgi:hypothetical protein